MEDEKEKNGTESFANSQNFRNFAAGKADHNI